MAKRNLNDLENLIVTARVIGQIIGVTDRRVRQLAQEGTIPKYESGSYELVPTLKAYINYIRVGSDAEDSNKSKLDKEKYLHEKAKREKAELILGEMKGELHDATIVEEVMTDMLSNFRSKLLAIPSKTAPILLGIDDIPEIQEILEEKIYEALKELSDYDPVAFQSDKYIEEVDEDEQDTKAVQGNK